MDRLEKNMMSLSKVSTRGFTLIELMIVVLIVAIIAAVAVPIYSDYIVRSNRADAADQITAVMNQQERFQTRNRRYSDDLTDLGYQVCLLYTSDAAYE